MLKKLVPLVAAVGAVLALGACGSRTVVVADGQNANVITVNASAVAKVVPDKASFNVECNANAATADEAQQAGSAQVNAVLAALREAGVEDESIQTSYTDLSPVYDWEAETSDGKPRITGYEMRTSLAVRDVDVDAVSGLMETCVAAGATGVNGPNYYVSSYDSAYEQALADAVAASKPKAEALAKASGTTLGEVISVTEGYQNTSYRYEEKAMADAGAGVTEDALEMEIAPGEVSIEAQVTVTYAMG